MSRSPVGREVSRRRAHRCSVARGTPGRWYGAGKPGPPNRLDRLWIPCTRSRGRPHRRREVAVVAARRPGVALDREPATRRYRDVDQLNVWHLGRRARAPKKRGSLVRRHRVCPQMGHHDRSWWVPVRHPAPGTRKAAPEPGPAEAHGGALTIALPPGRGPGGALGRGSRVFLGDGGRGTGGCFVAAGSPAVGVEGVSMGPEDSAAEVGEGACEPSAVAEASPVVASPPMDFVAAQPATISPTTITHAVQRLVRLTLMAPSFPRCGRHGPPPA